MSLAEPLRLAASILMRARTMPKEIFIYKLPELQVKSNFRDTVRYAAIITDGYGWQEAEQKII